MRPPSPRGTGPRSTLTTVLGEAGFDIIDWLPHRTTATGTDAYLRPYLSVPHAPFSAA